VGLLLFPVMSGLACLAVLASFALPLWHTNYFALVMGQRHLPNDPIAYVIVFAFYFVNYFVITFFNSALIACAVIRFKGGEPTLGDGMRAAMMRLPQILGWSAVSATVGLILQLIESRSEKVGQVVSALLGMGWSLVSYFVVPVLVVEGVGPMTAIQRSLKVMRKTWGESLSANFGISAIAFLFSLPAIVCVTAGAVALANGNAALGAALLVLGLAAVLLVALVSTTVHSILLAALYIYAAEGVVPGQFDSSSLRQAFSPK
jgi:hypothetical protein